MRRKEKKYSRPQHSCCSCDFDPMLLSLLTYGYSMMFTTLEQSRQHTPSTGLFASSLTGNGAMVSADPLPFIFVALFFLIPLWGLDVLLRRAFSYQARWFQLHCAANAVICMTAWPEVWDIIRDPQEAFELSGNRLGVIFTFSLHLYHMLFFELSFIDKCHHISSVFLCMPLSLCLNRKVFSFLLFIGSGLPGGIDYLLLALMKNKIILPIYEKKWNGWLNAYIRAPFGAMGSGLTYMIARQAEPWSAFQATAYFIALMSFLNTTFFAKLAIENHIMHHYKNSGKPTRRDCNVTHKTPREERTSLARALKYTSTEKTTKYE